ncbi:AbiH family protein, partial [Lactococcus lactis]
LYPNLFHNYYLKTSIMLCYIQCINTKNYNQSNLIFEIQSVSMDSRTLQKDKFKSQINNIQSKINNNETICLSFNYTKLMKNLNVRNIHGDLEKGNIIFGIDYDKLNKNFESNGGNSNNNKAGNDEYKFNKAPFEFSKSYRVLENGLTSTFDISSDIDIIKIYGHGLGKADYSYYQSIFDSVDLYHGKTKVMFFWSDYEGKEKEQIHKDFVKGVTNLIEEYGTTFTNKDHGRNLFTKLLLENRLTIQEIPVNALFLNV